ncbi:hypothetical protein C4D60_Mb09t18320 [Musa balbisiana]|uniref:Uncharacterized protein n=1 Tax=Musa balbisiana TaxID=52838 RepID=A0A4S8IIP0_MUSBA|nr:hypothetical protein C4D60_Mb09t18320 [Musa balbisiana]
MRRYPVSFYMTLITDEHLCHFLHYTIIAYELEPKCVISPDFRMLAVPPPLLGGTTTCRLTLDGTIAQSRWYDRLTELRDRALVVPSHDRVVPPLDNINCQRYHRPKHLGDRVPGSAIVGHDFRLMAWVVEGLEELRTTKRITKL